MKKKKNLILPSLCFAVLSTAAYEQIIDSGDRVLAAEFQPFAETQYVNVSSGSLNLREEASTNAKVIAGLANGTQVNVLAVDNGWAKIQANGKTGYVSSQFLGEEKASSKTETSAPAPAKPVATTTKYVNVSTSLNLRASASTSSKVLSSLSNGTSVKVLSEANGWSKVTAGGKTGYVSTQFLGKEKASSKTETSAPAPSKSVATRTKYVNVSTSLNLRASASTSSKVLTSLSKGTSVTVLSEANGWSKVTAAGKTGYVSSQFLSNENKQGSTNEAKPARTVTKVVNVSSGSSLNMRAAASTSSKVLVSLSKGTSVKVLSEANGWSKVTASGKTGYVSLQFLANNENKQGSTNEAKPAKTVTKVVNVSSGSSLNMRAAASTSSKVLASLSKGTSVKVLSEANGWSKVTAVGKTGYVSSQFLSNENKQGSTNEAKPAKTVTKVVNVSSGSSLNMRAAASTSSKVLASLSKGTSVTVLSEANGWSKIKVSGKTGYVSTEYLANTSNSSSTPAAPSQSVAITKAVKVQPGSSLNMRNKPTTKASVMIKLANGVKVTVLSEENGWAKIKIYGQEGYVSSEYLTIVQAETAPTPPVEELPSEPEVEKEPTPSPNTNVKYVNVSEGSTLNMRSEPSTKGRIVTALKRGTAVKIHAEENGWAKATANGQTGYISSQYLTTKTDQSESANRKVNTSYLQYDVTLDALVDMQMSAKPQTDKSYASYIREDALVFTDASTAKIKGNGWKVRGGAGTEHWEIGTIKNGETVNILSKMKGSDGYNWYQIEFKQSWVNASKEDVKNYLDPTNFVDDPVSSLQFLKLSESTSLDQFEVNEKILSGKGVLSGHAATFAAAAAKYGVNDVYLISHALLETGNGTSKLATGVEIYGKTVYNMFGIGAYDGSAVESGAKHAYNAGWFSPEQAIMGGAQFIAKGYISKGQDTLYKMRWNPDATIAKGTATHQYATDIGWATKQVSSIYNLYSLLDFYSISLEIPKYKS
ncbi:SH3 domain-containing protein [Mesobacillus maritimus]|uniref:SH3 domain-containing protein n=1 Tax=Mesobacillus maritimus TaxID=1643336 RepID=UPI0020422DC5|nr:SH3 domain-containing protein [Mesobacillus maritimus]MCM3670599.1 SH3 domain-containing protein [Mesobacillus maritimus]